MDWIYQIGQTVYIKGQNIVRKIKSRHSRVQSVQYLLDNGNYYREKDLLSEEQYFNSLRNAYEEEINYAQAMLNDLQGIIPLPDVSDVTVKVKHFIGEQVNYRHFDKIRTAEITKIKIVNEAVYYDTSSGDIIQDKNILDDQDISAIKQKEISDITKKITEIQNITPLPDASEKTIKVKCLIGQKVEYQDFEVIRTTTVQSIKIYNGEPYYHTALGDVIRNKDILNNTKIIQFYSDKINKLCS